MNPYQDWLITIIQEADTAEALGSDTTGIDVAASHDRYRELVTAALEDNYPGADVEWSRGGWSRITINAAGRLTPEEYAHYEEEMPRTIRDIMDQVFNDGKWAVEVSNEAV